MKEGDVTMLIEMDASLKITDEEDSFSNSNRALNINIKAEGDDVSVEYIKNALPMFISQINNIILDCQVNPEDIFQERGSNYNENNI